MRQRQKESRDNKSTLATNEFSLENTSCKAGKRRGKNTESNTMQEDLLSGDHREKGKVSTPKRSKGYPQTGEHRGETT